ncbi:MAG: hypothetical protein Q8P25_03840 [Candidatus Curtissbacteria bacterium]|nr:hypothetical protein [Candidatus Curtissbacteria bacterium]
MSKNILVLLLIFLVVLLLYHPVFGVYFSQDDFFHFRASQTDGSLSSFIKLFGFPTFEERGYAFYRPVSREGFYNLYYLLFGLNAVPFRLMSFLIHFINISLVFSFMERLFKKRAISLFTAFFFGITAANVGVLYYGAGGIETSGVTMFFLLSLLFFWKYLEGEGNKFKTLSFIAFLFALGSHELGAITPIVLSGLIFIRQQSFVKATKLAIHELWSFFAVLLGYLYLDVVRIGFLQKEEQYRIVLSIKKVLNSFGWYTAWALGVPEMLVDYVRPGLKLNPSLMRYWGEYFKIIFPAFIISAAALVGSIVYLFFNQNEKLRDKKFWFLVIWFPFSLFPVILLPFHKYTHYLVPALPAFWGAVGFVGFSAYWQAKKRYPRSSTVLLSGLILILIVLSVTAARLGSSTYWAVSHGRIAEGLLNDIKSMYPQLPKGAIVYFKNDPNYPFIAEEWGGTSKQASLVLIGSAALQLLYKDSSIQVFYEDLGGVPKDFSKNKVYSLVARLQ